MIKLKPSYTEAELSNMSLEQLEQLDRAVSDSTSNRSMAVGGKMPDKAQPWPGPCENIPCNGDPGTCLWVGYPILAGENNQFGIHWGINFGGHGNCTPPIDGTECINCTDVNNPNGNKGCHKGCHQYLVEKTGCNSHWYPGDMTMGQPVDWGTTSDEYNFDCLAANCSANDPNINNFNSSHGHGSVCHCEYPFSDLPECNQECPCQDFMDIGQNEPWIIHFIPDCVNPGACHPGFWVETQSCYSPEVFGADLTCWCPSENGWGEGGSCEPTTESRGYAGGVKIPFPRGATNTNFDPNLYVIRGLSGQYYTSDNSDILNLTKGGATGEVIQIPDKQIPAISRTISTPKRKMARGGGTRPKRSIKKSRKQKSIRPLVTMTGCDDNQCNNDSHLGCEGGCGGDGICMACCDLYGSDYYMCSGQQATCTGAAEPGCWNGTDACSQEGSTCGPITAIAGCTNSSACNYNPAATEDDGSCLENDCADVCGGWAQDNSCGVCDGPYINFNCTSGGGCFVENTLVSTPKGQIPIQDLKVDDKVNTFKDGSDELTTSTIEKLFHHSENDTMFGLYKITTDNKEVIVTGEHSFATSENGELIWDNVVNFNIGDKLYIEDGEIETIISKEKLNYSEPTYNFEVKDTHTYIADGFRVHNKLKCFVAGTLVSTPNGEVPIEDIKHGDEIYTFKLESEELFTTTVNSLISHPVDIEEVELYELKTDNHSVVATGNHPFVKLLDDGSPLWTMIVRLNVGDKVYTEDGEAETIISITLLERKEPTYNLEVNDTHTYIADGFRVHNAFFRDEEYIPGDSVMDFKFIDCIRQYCEGHDTWQTGGPAVSNVLPISWDISVTDEMYKMIPPGKMPNYNLYSSWEDFINKTNVLSTEGDICDCDGNECDACRVCGGDGPSGCDNVCGSTLENDDCGTCGGDYWCIDAECTTYSNGYCDCGTSTYDCTFEYFNMETWGSACGGSAVEDSCGICGGDNSSCELGEDPLPDPCCMGECSRDPGISLYDSTDWHYTNCHRNSINDGSGVSCSTCCTGSANYSWQASFSCNYDEPWCQCPIGQCICYAGGTNTSWGCSCNESGGLLKKGGKLQKDGRTKWK